MLRVSEHYAHGFIAIEKPTRLLFSMRKWWAWYANDGRHEDEPHAWRSHKAPGL